MQKDGLLLSLNEEFGDFYLYLGPPDLTLKPLRAPTPLAEIIEWILDNGFHSSGEQSGFRVYMCKTPSKELLDILKELEDVLQRIDKAVLVGKEEEVAEAFSIVEIGRKLSSFEEVKELLGLLKMALEIHRL